MTTIAYGSKYAEALTVTEIAARVRAEVRKAVKDHTLGELPEGLRLGVTSERGIGASITIVLKSADDQWLLADRPDVPGLKCISAAAKALGSKLHAILYAYNFDGNDLRSDYINQRFHASVETEHGTLIPRI